MKKTEELKEKLNELQKRISFLIDEFHLENGIGYYSFECDFYFLKGNFLNHGVWE